MLAPVQRGHYWLGWSTTWPHMCVRAYAVPFAYWELDLDYTA
jgi:hypothetical protein